MNKPILTAAVTTVVSQFPCVIKRLTGYYAGAANAYLQIHEKDEVSAGDVPKLSLIILPGDRFEYIPNIDLGACIVAVSSTQATYTANATGITGDIEYNKPPTTEGTEVGDLDMDVSRLEVLATAGRVKKIHFINGAAAVRYLQLHRVATAAVESATIDMVYPVAANGTRILSFGNDGEYCSALTAVVSDDADALVESSEQHAIKAWVV